MIRIGQVTLTHEQEVPELVRKTEQAKLLEDILNSIQFPSRPDFLPFISNENHFDVVRNESELLEAFLLRFIAYCDAQYIIPDKFPLKMDFDKYDAVSVHFVVRDTETKKLKGYSRFILDTPLGLQVDDCIDISDYRRDYCVAEHSRMISYPRRQPDVNRSIRYITYMFAQMLGIQKIVGISLERDKEWFDHNRILPMEPYRTCRFEGEIYNPSIKDLLRYGNVFHLDRYGSEYIKELKSQLNHSGDR